MPNKIIVAYEPRLSKRLRPIRKDLTKNFKGKKFGYLTAIENTWLQDMKCTWVWRFKCVCGNSVLASVRSVGKNQRTSCGCKTVDFLDQKGQKNKMFKHGYFGTATYRSWDAMRYRCNNKNSKDYKNWGGRGIKVCKRWDKFENFLKDMGERPPKTSIDRIDNEGDYTPSNCRWADAKTQINNRRKFKRNRD